MAAPVIGTRPRFAPRVGAVVDRSHPLAQRLEFCFVPVLGPIDLAKGYRATITGTPTLASTKFGPAMKLSGVTYYSFAGVPDAPFLGPTTFLWAGRTEKAAGTYAYVAGKMVGATANQNVPFSLYFGGATWSFDTIKGGSSTSSNWVTSTFATGAGSSFVSKQDYAIVTTTPSDLSQSGFPGYTDTYQQTYTTATITGTCAGVNSALHVGARPNDSLTGETVNAIFAIWSRTLSPGEAKQLTGDPFCFLRY